MSLELEAVWVKRLLGQMSLVKCFAGVTSLGLLLKAPMDPAVQRGSR